MEFENQNEKYSKLFKIIIALLMSFGIIMVYSASYMSAKEHYGSSLYFINRQVMFAIVAFLGAFVIAKSKYQFWYKYSFYLNIIVSFLIILTFIPGLGVLAKGANRWISLFGFSLQPGEFAKYTTLILSLYFFENFEELDLKRKIQYALNIAFTFLLLLMQPDFGTFFICFVGMFLSCFVSKFSRKIFYSMLAIGPVLASLILIAQPYRVKRLTAFLDPWANAQGSGFQVIQSWIGFANGGFFGKGVGNSIEKLFYLPEAHNDFIFSVIGEEFGFLGVIFLSTLFLGFVYYGYRISISLKDKAARQISTLIVSLIGVQAALNMAVVLGLLPTKGLNLPFISYGGSSLLSNVIAIGLVFACQRPTIGQNASHS